MSYCRWSSDDFGCDLYCYESGSGYTTHVAASRVVGDVPKVPDLSEPKAFVAAMRAQTDFMMLAARVPIGLACDGITFNDPDLASFRARIVSLREMGYRCPDYVLERIDEEIAEGA